MKTQKIQDLCLQWVSLLNALLKTSPNFKFQIHIFLICLCIKKREKCLYEINFLLENILLPKKHSHNWLWREFLNVVEEFSPSYNFWKLFHPLPVLSLQSFVNISRMNPFTLSNFFSSYSFLYSLSFRSISKSFMGSFIARDTVLTCVINGWMEEV